MTLKHLFASAVSLMVGACAWAQTDVTSTYLENADFNSGTTVSTHLCGYVADINKEANLYNGTPAAYYAQPVEGWTVAIGTADGGAGGLFPYGSDYQLKGNAVTAPATNPNEEATGNALAIFAVWGNAVQYTQAAKSALAAGDYTFTYTYYNQSGTSNVNNMIGFVEESGTTHYATTKSFTTGAWTTESFTFSLAAETAGSFSVGYKSLGSGSSANPMLFIDNIQLSYTAVVVKTTLEEAIATATTVNGVLNNSDLAAAIAEAQAVVDNASATQEEVNAATTTLNEAIAAAKKNIPNETNVTALFVVNNSFETGDLTGWTCYSANDTGVKPNSNATYTCSNTDGDYLFNTWGGTAEKYINQTLTNLPEGYYTVSALIASDANVTINLLAGDTKTAVETSAEGKGVLMPGTSGKVYVADGGSLLIGASSTNWYKVDNFQVVYYSADAAASEAYDDAVAEAKALLENADYANVTGSERTALDELANPATTPSTKDEYVAATEALQAAMTTFTAAKAAYDAFAAAKATTVPELAYASADKLTALNEAIEVEEVASADDATAKAAAIATALRAYYESHAKAEGVDGAVDMTEKIVNANDPSTNDGWTLEGTMNNPLSNESWTDADGTNNHSYFDGGKWSASAWTTTMQQTIEIPAGKYLLTAKGRSSANTTVTMAVGEASVEMPHVGSKGNVFDRGWGDASVEFETEGGEVVILVTATTENQHEWFSISDFRLVQLESNEIPTAIENIDVKKNGNVAVYDLSGKAVKVVKKGIYVVDGKKVAVK